MADRTPDQHGPADARVLAGIWEWTATAVTPVDAAAIARAAVTTPASSGVLGTLRGLRFRRRPLPVPLIVPLILLVLAVFGSSLLIAGQRTTPMPQDLDLLEGFVTEDAGSGVLRIVNDGVRDLDWAVTDLPYGGFESGVAVAVDGSVWLKQGATVFELGEGSSDDIPRWSDLTADTSSRHWATSGDRPVLVDGEPWLGGRSLGPIDYDKYKVGVGPNGTVWIRTGQRRLFRYEPRSDTLTRYDGTDGVPNMHAVLDAPGLFHVALDDSLWVTGTERYSHCDGVSRFDGRTWAHYLPGQCVYSMDSAPDGSLWLQASSVTSDEMYASATSSAYLYRIQPEPDG